MACVVTIVAAAPVGARISRSWGGECDLMLIINILSNQTIVFI